MPTTQIPFSALLRPLVQRIGTAKAAQLCEVSPRTIQLWLAHPEKPPALAMQFGVIALLSRGKSRVDKAPAAITDSTT